MPLPNVNKPIQLFNCRRKWTSKWIKYRKLRIMMKSTKYSFSWHDEQFEMKMSCGSHRTAALRPLYMSQRSARAELKEICANK